MSKRKTLWVLEDEDSIIQMYQQSLVVKYNVEFFKTIHELMAELKSEKPKPDLLISDLVLNNESFMETLSDPQSLKYLTIPFIVVSGSGDIEIMRDCFKYGAIDYLCKPFKSPEVLLKVERAIANLGQVLSVQSSVPGIVVDPKLMTIKGSTGETAAITVKELQIYTEITTQIGKGKKVLRKDLLESLKELHLSMNSLDVHLSRLRKKLEAIGFSLEYNELTGYYFSKTKA